MHYYITLPDVPLKDGYDYKFFTVKEADNANFLEDYGDKVIAQGSNLLEALLNLEQWKQEQS